MVSKKLTLEQRIRKEPIALTEKIMYFGKGDSRPDYYIYWEMEGRKTNWGQGMILLVDNERVLESFKEAFDKKYRIEIPKSTKYDYLINRKIEKKRKQIAIKYII